MRKSEWVEKVKGFCSIEMPEEILDRYIRHLWLCLPDDHTEALFMDRRIDLDMPTQGAGILEIFELKDIKSAFSSSLKIENWHYCRTTECLLVNLNRGVHEYLSGTLYNLFMYPSELTEEDGAEQFITDGLGFFRSTSSYGRAMKGKDVKLSGQEKAAFASTIFVDM